MGTLIKTPPYMPNFSIYQEGIKHKNYDLEAPKDEIDLFYSKDEFLSQADKELDSISAKRVIS